MTETLPASVKQSLIDVFITTSASDEELKFYPACRPTAVKFLSAQSWFPTKAIDCFKTYLKLMKARNFFDVNLNEPDFKRELFSEKLTVVPDQRDPRGSVVAVVDVSRHDPKASRIWDTIHAFLFQIDAIFEQEEAQRTGLTLVFDFEGFRWAAYQQDFYNTLFQILQVAFPCWLTRIIVYNPPFVAKPIIEVWKKILLLPVLVVKRGNHILQLLGDACPVRFGGKHFHLHKHWLKLYCIPRMTKHSYYRSLGTRSLKDSYYDVNVVTVSLFRSTPLVQTALKAAGSHECLPTEILSTKQLATTAECESAAQFFARISKSPLAQPPAQEATLKIHSFSSATKLVSVSSNSIFCRQVPSSSSSGKGLVKHATATVPIDQVCDSMLQQAKFMSKKAMIKKAESSQQQVRLETTSVSGQNEATKEKDLLSVHQPNAAGLTPGQLRRRVEKEFDIIGTEFAQLADERISDVTFDLCSRKENKAKNRYRDVPCYDHSIVVLNPLDVDVSSSYIHASFVDGYQSKNAYICTQAPTANTLEDFWRMVYEQKSFLIVMVTNLVEKGKTKSECYWPIEEGAVQEFGDFTVTNSASVKKKGIVVSSLFVRYEKTCRSQIVYHYWYKTWEDMGEPNLTDFFLLVDEVSRARRLYLHKLWPNWNTENPNCKLGPPVIVHCSAGVGRTGTFCTVSINMDRLNDQGMIDVFGTVRKLRKQRWGSVQTLKQFEFCYNALLEHCKRKELLISSNVSCDTLPIAGSDCDHICPGNSTTLVRVQNSLNDDLANKRAEECSKEAETEMENALDKLQEIVEKMRASVLSTRPDSK